MKTDDLHRSRRFLRNWGWALVLSVVLGASAAPKRVLVVGVTEGFRHSSIEVGMQVISQLAHDTGLFTVDIANVNPNAPEFRGPDGKPDRAKVQAANKRLLAEKMSPAALANYDLVIFNSTTGDLPIPDMQAFLDWIRSGRGFVGVHAATDTFRGHRPFHPYVQMIGGEFKYHGPQVGVEIINQDPAHAACQHLPNPWKVFDEIYILDGFERAAVHGLLTLDKHPNEKTPGDYPIAWCKTFGKGRVFYTSLGHREDVWDPNWRDGNGQRANPPEVAVAFQRHLLGGIKWALGLP
ncbi:ThuA domain-containing protein [Limisphaera sp. VF-2]|jgi:type 1 glutamine amidotransferase|uniref:ThuA domain-containing protein n=1 Tax=Limisphaera sp. VF-2 TaxID=3400418 RepID=UPI00255D81B8|nr:ThuA domain-containing protein [Limisphaera sp.]